MAQPTENQQPVAQIARDVEVDLRPLKVKGYRLTQDTLELIARDIKDMSKIGAKTSAAWGASLTLLLQFLIINPIWKIQQPTQMIAFIVCFVAFIATAGFSIQWFFNRGNIEDIIKKRCNTDDDDT